MVDIGKRHSISSLPSQIPYNLIEKCLMRYFEVHNYNYTSLREEYIDGT